MDGIRALILDEADGKVAARIGKVDETLPPASSSSSAVKPITATFREC